MEQSRDNGIKTTVKKCGYVLAYYDRDGDHKLIFKEFLPLVLPLDNPALHAQATQKATYEVGHNERLPSGVEYALAKLLGQEIETHNVLERLKGAIFGRSDFNVQGAFKAIDTRHTRYIDFDSLLAFLRKRGANARQDDVVAFIRRFDLDFDRRVSYSEFVSGIVPVEPKTHTKPSYTTQTKAHQARSASTAQKVGDFKLRASKSFHFERQTPAPNALPCTPEKILRKGTGRLASSKTTLPRRGSTQSPDLEFARRDTRKPDEGPASSTPLKPRSNKAKAKAKSKTNIPLKQKDRLDLNADKSPTLSQKHSHSQTKGKGKGKSKSKGNTQSTLKKLALEPPKDGSGAKKDKKGKWTIFELMKEQMRLEERIEAVKQELALQRDVTLQRLYALLDTSHKGAVGAADLLEAFRTLGLDATAQEVYLVYTRFDTARDGKLRSSELAEAFLPAAADYATMLQSRTETQAEQATLSSTALALVQKLLAEYLKAETTNERLKLELGNLSVTQAFEQCDLRQVGYFTEEDVHSAL